MRQGEGERKEIELRGLRDRMGQRGESMNERVTKSEMGRKREGERYSETRIYRETKIERGR